MKALAVSAAADVVRILDAEGQHIGKGILVADRHLLSCAHVVNLALRWPRAGHAG
ncbi:hypothetical protein [Sedimentitalea sp.]|uniref:hypothetical protein n=1 Tax=Sedimentitalea sp. TaxID=2048915 RepID=UPI00329694E0